MCLGIPGHYYNVTLFIEEVIFHKVKNAYTMNESVHQLLILRDMYACIHYIYY